MSFEVFEQHIESQSLKAVARHWRSVRGDRPMPSWTDIRLPQIRRYMPIIWSYDYHRGKDRFIGRLAGVNIESIFGKTFRGTPMLELYPPKDYPRLFARAKRVVSTPELYRGAGMVFNHLDHSGSGERIMLPVASDHEHGDGILGATVYQFFLGERIEMEPEIDLWFRL